MTKAELEQEIIRRGERIEELEKELLSVISNPLDIIDGKAKNIVFGDKREVMK